MLRMRWATIADVAAVATLVVIGATFYFRAQEARKLPATSMPSVETKGIQLGDVPRELDRETRDWIKREQRDLDALFGGDGNEQKPAKKNSAEGLVPPTPVTPPVPGGGEGAVPGGNAPPGGPPAIPS